MRLDDESGRKCRAAVTPPTRTGILLLTFGTARPGDDLSVFLSGILQHQPTAVQVADLLRRYETIGWSPLLGINACLAQRLEQSLAHHPPVAFGARHGAPSITKGMADLVSQGCTTILALVLSPIESPDTTRYLCALTKARAQIGGQELSTTLLPAWNLHPDFTAALAKRLLATLTPDQDVDTTVLFTAHSLPANAQGADKYVHQLNATAKAVARRASVDASHWHLVFQSAPPTQTAAWLNPEILSTLGHLKSAHVTRVVICPLSFLCDHLEILYDIDVLAKNRANQLDIALSRIPMFNADDDIVEVLTNLLNDAISSVR